jgi:hypothetical protein
MTRPAVLRRCLAPLALLLLGTPARLLAAGPISHWSFEETEGTTVNDDGPGGHDGTLVGGAAFAPGEGMSGGALRLDSATGSSVTMGNVLGPDEYPSGQFSISVWVRLTLPSPNEQWIVSKHSPGWLNGFALAVGSNGGTGGTAHHAWLYVSNLPGGLPISTTPVDDGYWHHLVGVYDPLIENVVKIYVDGVLEDTSPHSAQGGNSAAFSIGGHGLIDEVSFYGWALSDEEVEDLYDALWLFHDNFESGAVCAWSFSTETCG